MDYREELLRTPQILERVMEEKQEAALTPRPASGLLRLRDLLLSLQSNGRPLRRSGKTGVGGRGCRAVGGWNPDQGAGGVFFISLPQRGFQGDRAGSACGAGSGLFDLLPGVYGGFAAGSGLRQLQSDPVCAGSAGAGELFLHGAALCLALCCGLKVSPRTPDLARAALEQAEAIYRSALTGMEIRRMICLGAPFYLPLLKELMLKNGEITQKFSEVWGLLEFRHGPRSWADRDCLVTAVPGVRTLAYDRRVAEELVSYGCRVLWCGPEPPAGTLAVKLEAAVRSVEECLALLTFQTGLAAEIGRACGVDADHLRHVVDSVGEL